MDYETCVAHHTQGRYKGQRCKSKGTRKLYDGSKLQVCAKHYSYYGMWYTPRWIREIIERGLLGRYNRA